MYLLNYYTLYFRTYLKDLIETNHIFMKLLEHTGKQQRNLVVLCKPKTKKATKSIYFINIILIMVFLL